MGIGDRERTAWLADTGRKLQRLLRSRTSNHRLRYPLARKACWLSDAWKGEGTEGWRTCWIRAGGEYLEHYGAVDADAGDSIEIKEC